MAKLDKALFFDIRDHGFESHCFSKKGSITQWLECSFDKRKVGSSNLPRPIIFYVY